MPLYFLIVSAINVFCLFALDCLFNRRIHPLYLKHFVLTMLAISLVSCIFIIFPQLNQSLSWERDANLFIKILGVIIGLLVFDAFVYFVHRYIEHGILWRWHKYHHTLFNDHDLTYYSASMVGPEESAYYLLIQLGVCILFRMGLFETLFFVTWVTQQGAYVHQKGLKQLPWPFLSSSHHRTHHFKPAKYYGGLFLFWDGFNPHKGIDPRALDGVSQ